MVKKKNVVYSKSNSLPNVLDHPDIYRAFNAVVLGPTRREELNITRRLLIEAIRQLGGSIEFDPDVLYEYLDEGKAITTYIDQDFDTNRMRFVIGYEDRT